MSRRAFEGGVGRESLRELSASLRSIAGSVRSGLDSESPEETPAITDGGTPIADSASDDLHPVGSGDSEIPEETLFRLVVDNGGRMHQSDLVEETSWSPARVSRRLKNLETAGWLRRVRQGRENVVFVPPAE